MQRQVDRLLPPNDKFFEIFLTLPDAAGSSRISDGRYNEINPAFERVLGYRRDELIGRTAQEVGIWAGPQEREKLLRAYAQHGQVDRLDMVARHRDGRLVPGQMSVRPTRIGDEDCFVFVFHDLTREKQVEGELMFSKSALDAAGRLGRLGAWVIYYDGVRSDYWSPVCREITGIGADEPVPQDFAERFVLPPYRDQLRALEQRCREQGIGWDIELLIQRHQGPAIWMRIVGEPVMVDGRVDCVQGLMQDVDESRRSLEKLRQSEEKFARIFRGQPEAMAILNRESGRYLDVNPAWELLTGHSREDALGRHATELGVITLEQRDHLTALLAQANKVDDVEVVINSRSGQQRFALVSMRSIEIDSVDCLVSMHRDITERREAQARIQEREEQLSLSFSVANFGLWDWDLTSNQVSGNERWLELRGLRAQGPLLASDWVRASIHADDRTRVMDAIMANIKGKSPLFDTVSRCTWDDGEVRWVRDLGRVVKRADDGTALRMLGLTMDVTDQRMHQERLHSLAHYDPLTGLPNRVLLADRMKQAMLQAERTGETLGVVYLDLDGFKPINDRLGHNAGDQLLRMVAQQLTHSLRSADSVARLGGDEFVLLLAGLDGREDCELAIRRAMASICAPQRVHGEDVVVTASMGATLYPQDQSDADTLLRHADQAMYLAKQAGRNRFHFFDADLDQSAREQVARVGRLRQAMDNGELVLYLQPRVNMKTGEVLGAEALARWRHPSQGLLGPSHFLSDIEDSELNLPFGQWVIGQALGLLQRWKARSLTLGLSINISARHLQSTDFVTQLQLALQAHPSVAPQSLEVEVTESGSLTDLEAAIRAIRGMQALGVRVALDDFGTGYSSLNYLRRLPVNTLKVDQSFVRDMLHDRDAHAIVQSVISMAQSFDRAVIAEGVESVEQGRALIELGCNMAQGYFMARPMPEQQLDHWLSDWVCPPEWRRQTGH